ncbi:helix-turn-helix domain-containing protein [Aristophania vespae]|uniref:helix-turn-helix domain-containing protein n=1 Tax=Aristophania vespae TaxID=2697033 RepID=UPI002351C116|nr:helix-turn-helix domain-containing protein [Aristophania vespae]UMM64344.1 hypothetical protein DM15PD_13580 [Aristophania vespae]
MNKNPTPDEIKKTRLKAGFTQSKAASLASVTLNAWQKWEQGTRKPTPQIWELFLLKLKRK